MQSRPFKYKAWDSQCEVMIEGFAIYAEGDHLGISTHDSGEFYTEEEIEKGDGSHFSQGDDWVFIMNNFHLLQFTGLPDKNGKEIYEGDIVRVDDKIMVVQMLEGCWRTKYGEYTNYRLYGWAEKSLEVIGNIHEHANLLENKE